MPCTAAKPRLITIGAVPGRPALDGPEIVSGIEAWHRMTHLVEAALAAAGEAPRVERSSVQVFRGGERPDR